MNPAVGIRPATAGDLDAVECVERRCFPEGEAFTRRQLLYLLTHAQGASYAATRDGAVVGYISLLMRRSFCVGAVGDFTSVDYFLPPGICQGDAFITLLAGIQLSFHRLLYGEIAKAPGRRILVPRRFIGNKIGSSKLSKHCVGQMDRLPVRTQKQHIKIPLRYFHQFSNEHTPSNPDKPAPIFSPFCNMADSDDARKLVS